MDNRTDQDKRVSISDDSVIVDLEDDEESEENNSLFYSLEKRRDIKSIKKKEKPVSPLEAAKNISSKIDFKRLKSLAKAESTYIIWGTVCLFIANVSLLGVPFVVGKIIDAVTGHEEDAREQLLNAVFLLLVLVTISAIFASIRAYLFTIAGERVVVRLRKQLFQSMIVQEIAFFDESKTGELLNRLASDCTVLQNTVTVNVSMSLRSVFSLFAGIVMLFYLSWKLTLVTIAVIPIIVGASVVYGKFVKKLSKDFQESLAHASDVANEALSNVRTVRSFSQEEFEMEQYSEKIDVTFELARKRSWAYGAFTGLITFFANIAVGFVLWYDGHLVIEGEMSPGTLTSFIIYTLSVAVSVGTVTSLYGDVMKAIGSSERVFELLDRQPKVHWKGGISPDKVRGVLKLENVHFSYPSRPDVVVLKGIHLTLDPGKVVALVGPSGGGKSTIVALLELFYYPTSGIITFDGNDLSKIDPQVYRKHIGIVSQEPALFGLTIAQNIAYGRPNASKERIMEVAKMANAHDFIMNFPDGYDTMVGERGIKLSGGQKQRVAIARAFLTDPSILLLDEATSALDAESEYLVKGALETLMKGRTTLVIAHRLSTVKNADVVCVIDKGVISEQGTHEELISRPNGTYRQLVQRQLLQNN